MIRRLYIESLIAEERALADVTVSHSDSVGDSLVALDALTSERRR